MSLLRKRGLDVQLVVFAPAGEFLRSGLRERWQTRRREVAEVFELPLTLLPTAPNRLQGLWRDSLPLSVWLGKQRPSSPTILHCRGTLATHTALAARRGRSDLAVISDCRGIEAPEYLMHQGVKRPEDTPPDVRRRYDWLEQRQRRAIEQADRVLCVSDAMRRELEARWSMPPERMRTVPCCTDTDAGQAAIATRTEVRARLGLADKLVVSYSGSAAPWQVLPQTLATFRQIAELRSNAHLLVLTPDVKRIAAAIAESGIAADRATVTSVPHRQVAAHLAASDLGLLLREADVVNRVASPMKFAEYIAAGVPVVLTDQIGDVSDMVRDEGIGCVLPKLGRHEANTPPLRLLLDTLDRDPAAMRRRCCDAAVRYMSWDGAIDAICASYGEISGLRVRSAAPSGPMAQIAT